MDQVPPFGYIQSGKGQHYLPAQKLQLRCLLQNIVQREANNNEATEAHSKYIQL